MSRLSWLGWFVCLGWCAGVVANGCATTAGKQASVIAEKCGAQVAADVVVEVSTGLDTSTAALEADAVRYGVPLVLCVIGQLVTLPPPASSTARLPPVTDRQRIAIEFMAVHR